MYEYKIKPRFEEIAPLYDLDNAKTIISNKELQEIMKNEFSNSSVENELSGGRINKVFKIKQNNTEIAVKFSYGKYRVTELYREANILRYLNDEGHNELVPKIISFNKKEQVAYLSEEFLKGKSVREMLNTDKDSEMIAFIWQSIGKVLSKIHQNFEGVDLNYLWLNGQLQLAKINLDKELIDLDDFSNEKPADILKWLFKNKPNRTQVSLLHGDFRTKNIIFHNNESFKVIDWGFVDIGDPIYDLAIIDYCFKDEQNRESFYKGYSEIQYDIDLINYYEKLSRFINI